jgi:hypothetical protein
MWRTNPITLISAEREINKTFKVVDSIVTPTIIELIRSKANKTNDMIITTIHVNIV